MTEIRCPRCLQYWYTEEEDGGRTRLCARCEGELRRDGGGSRARVDAFLITTGVALGVALVLIGLTAFWPTVFGPVILVGGLLLFTVGLVLLRRVAGYGHVGDVDWSVARWPALLVLVGLAWLLAFASFVALPRAK